MLGNHDRHRVASRIGRAQARVAAMLLLTLRGTPTLYYGDEIGMQDVVIPPGLAQDPWEKNVPGLGLGRDPERTPMQWDAGPNAGFSTGRPWLPIAPDAAEVNVARERDDPRSMLSLHRRLLAVRREHPALSVGGYALVDVSDDVLIFQRTAGRSRCVVALNLGSELVDVPLPSTFARSSLLVSTHMDRENEHVSKDVELRPDEGVVLTPA